MIQRRRGFAPKKKPKRIKSYSEKRMIQGFKYKKLRLEFLEKNPMCKAHLPGCALRSCQVHHKAGRIGKLLNDVTKWLAVCDPCHRWIEMHAIEAKALGFSEDRL